MFAEVNVDHYTPYTHTHMCSCLRFKRPDSQPPEARGRVHIDRSDLSETWPGAGVSKRGR